LEVVKPPTRRLETIVSPQVRRRIKRRLGLLGAHDAPYFKLTPPDIQSGQEYGPPDFVGIGVQRAGTSWWFDLLTAQPGIHHRSILEIHKERQYFSHLAFSDMTKSDMEKEYFRWFPKPVNAITGEWTPDYFYYSWVPARLKIVAPDTRLLLLLRDPIDRMVSGVMHLTALNQGAIPPGDIIQTAFQRGLYALQLRHWLVEFPMEQLLVLQYERCIADAVGELKRTVDFLGTPFDPAKVVRTGGRVNASQGSKLHLSPEVMQRFAGFYWEDVQELKAMLPQLDLDLWPTFTSAI